MSNTAVGNVYQTIIDEVISSSRVDFEENGVEESVLEDLRLVWQSKLTQLNVATFPWDPKPEPPPPAQAAPPPQPAPPSHSQAHFSPQLPLPNPGPGQNGGQQDHSQVYKQEPGIKQEPGSQPVMPSGVPYAQDQKSNNIAASRAAQLVQQYGTRTSNMPQGPPAHPQHVHQVQQAQHGQPMTPQQQMYRQQMAAQQQQQQRPPQNGQSSLQNGQTDGGGDDEMDDDDDDEEDQDDFEAVLMRRSQAGELQELGRVDVDRLLHEHMASKAKAMEGGGLMVPLKEATKHKTARNVDRKGKGIAAHDGGDEEDEDAINSDLDDPEDERNDEDAEDELGHIMLCMYDKVQRVKNKWKCTLKDGVLTVNGKEYVFHKATGEYEW